MKTHLLLPFAICLLVAYCPKAKADFTKPMTISPISPKGMWKTPQLAKHVSATLNLTVEPTGDVGIHKYHLKKGPIADQRGKDVLWTGNVQPGLSTLSILNTAKAPTTETLVVSCIWEVDKGTGSAGTGGTPPPDIDGEAKGIAVLGGTNVSWSFDRELQLADGQKAIKWTASFTDGNGAPVSVSVGGVSATTIAPTGTTWTVNPTTGSTSAVSEWSGTVLTGTPSTGHLTISYENTTEENSEPLTFATVTFKSLKTSTALSKIKANKFLVLSEWEGHATVAPASAAASIQFLYFQNINAQNRFIDVEGFTLNTDQDTRVGIDVGFVTDEPQVTGDDVKVTGLDEAGVFGRWGGLGGGAVQQNFNTYLRYRLVSNDPWTTIGKVNWFWGGLFRRIAKTGDPAKDFELFGGTDAATGAASAEEPTTPTTTAPE